MVDPLSLCRAAPMQSSAKPEGGTLSMMMSHDRDELRLNVIAET